MKTVSFDSMSVTELQERYRLFGRKGQSLCGRAVDGKPLGASVKQFFDELLAGVTDPVQQEARRVFMVKAMTEPAARQQLCGIRVETLNNYILATNNIASMFFEVVNLADDERPVVQNTTDQEISVSYVGTDGGLKMVKVVKEDDEQLINLRLLTTDKVRYRRVDIYRGSVIDAALKTLRMAYDMKNQIDGKCYQLLTDPTLGAFGTFRYYKDGGASLPKRSNYVFLPNSRINVANLPKTNDLTLADNGVNTSFRYECLRSIVRYFAMWQGAFPEGDLIPTGRILIPGADVADIATEIVPSGNTNNPVANELLEHGWTRINYLGRNWVLESDNTLPPGSCLVEANRKPGRVYFKPSQDRDQVRGEEDYALSQDNEEERWAQKVFGVYINSATRMNVLRINYRTPAAP